jgi:uncharacterized protein YkwD
MRKTLLVVVALLAAFSVAACTPNPHNLGQHRKVIRQKHNEKRSNHGVGSLARSKYAHDRAQEAANRVAAESGGGCVLRHTDGNTLLAWYNAAAAENLACITGCIDSGAGFRAFWKSPPHRQNILNGAYHRIGVGIQCVGSRSYFAIHLVA